MHPVVEKECIVIMASSLNLNMLLGIGLIKIKMGEFDWLQEMFQFQYCLRLVVHSMLGTIGSAVI